MSEKAFDVQKFIDDSKNALLKPGEYFASMPVTGGFVEPVIKAVIYGLVAGIFGLIWNVAGLSAAAGMFGGGAVGVMILIWSLIFALVGLFIGGVIVLVVSAITGGKTDYETCIRVTASLMVLSPVSSLLGFAGGIHYSLGAIVTLLVSLYGLYMLYQALVKSLGAADGKAKVVSIILAVIPALMLLSALVCTKAVTSSADKWIKQSEKMQKEFEKGEGAEALRKLQEAAKKMEEAQKK